MKFVIVLTDFSACLYGGGSRKDQIGLVSSGLEIVIGDVVKWSTTYTVGSYLLHCLATPGRLNDLIMNNLISVRSVSYLVR